MSRIGNFHIGTFGFNSSRAMYNGSIRLFRNHVELDITGSIYQPQIINFIITDVSDEVFRISTIYHAELFIARINLIIAMLCIEHRILLSAFFISHFAAIPTPDNIFRFIQNNVDATLAGLTAIVNNTLGAQRNEFGFIS